MDLHLDNLWARVAVASDEERAWLREYLTFEEARYVQPRGYRAKRVAPRQRCLLNVFTDSFPAGMVPVVDRAAAKAGFAVHVLDVRSPPFSFPSPPLAPDWLRGYQATAFRTVLERVRGVLWMPTGAGKTEVAIALVQAVPVRWLFLVHRKGLLGQAAERYEARTGERAGRVGDGYWREERFTVATFQTIAKALRTCDQSRQRANGLLGRAEGLIVDEVHALPAESHHAVAMSAPNAYWRVGLSGTPMGRGDKRSMLLVAALGPVIYRLAPERLIGEGVLARPVIRMLRVEQSCGAITWQGVYAQAVVRSGARNRVVVDAVRRAAKPCLLFVKELRHGRELCARLGKAGLRVEFAHGSDSTRWRVDRIAALVRGYLDALVATVIMQEGIDIPPLASVVVASGGRSAIAALQRIGRGMRSDDGRKATFEVWDFADVGHPWLERHTRERVRAYESEGFGVAPDGADSSAS